MLVAGAGDEMRGGQGNYGQYFIRISGTTRCIINRILHLLDRNPGVQSSPAGTGNIADGQADTPRTLLEPGRRHGVPGWPAAPDRSLPDGLARVPRADTIAAGRIDQPWT